MTGSQHLNNGKSIGGMGVALFYLHFLCFDKNTPMKSNFWGNGFVWLTDLD